MQNVKIFSATLSACRKVVRASRIGLMVDAFQGLGSGFRRNDDLIRAFLVCGNAFDDPEHRYTADHVRRQVYRPAW
jgi:hypothetical protein